jgi:hypothetical protein
MPSHTTYVIEYAKKQNTRLSVFKTNVQEDHQGNETNTSALDMNGQVLNPTARRSSSLLILNKDVSSTLDKAAKCQGYDISQESSAECWIQILALRDEYSRKKFTTVRGSEQMDDSSSTQNSQVCE